MGFIQFGDLSVAARYKNEELESLVNIREPPDGLHWKIICNEDFRRFCRRNGSDW